MKRSIATLLIALLACADAQAQTETIVLVADPWCPHTCSEGSDLPGYMIEVASRAFQLKGIQVVYRNAAWARAMSDVREGRIDGAVGALATEAQDLALHHEALGRQANALAVRTDDSWHLAGLDSLNGRLIGTIKDYSYSPGVDAWLAAHPAQVQPLGGQNALDRNLRKLITGRIDTVIEDEAVLRYALRTRPDEAKVRLAGQLDGGDLFIAFTKSGNRGPRLVHVLDDGIRDLRASGELGRILARYGLKDWKH